MPGEKDKDTGQPVFKTDASLIAAFITTEGMGTGHQHTQLKKPDMSLVS